MSGKTMALPYTPEKSHYIKNSDTRAYPESAQTLRELRLMSWIMSGLLGTGLAFSAIALLVLR